MKVNNKGPKHLHLALLSLMKTNIIKSMFVNNKAKVNWNKMKNK